MKKLLLLFILVATSVAAFSQEPVDSIKILNEVTIRAYEADRPLLEVPASIGLVFKSDLDRFSNTSLVSAVNALPGIRMEERSPGSYRFSIRGSSLRSPFGVRNVKAYWNELPITDPGGNTYLNQFDANSIEQIEIIKGPGSSIYGAGTGGVLLLKSPTTKKENTLTGSWVSGSYGLQNYQLALNQGNDKTSHYLGYQHQEIDGYREQTRMVRDLINSTFRFAVSDKEELETAIFYTDLYYETPGGLTQLEYESDPQQARPGTGTQPGAVEQQASVALKSFYAGVSHQYHFSKSLHNRTGVYGNFVQFNNAAIRNYERRAEQNFGARTVTDYSFQVANWKAKLLGGGEFMNGFSPIKTYENLQGSPGLLQNDDEVNTLQYNIFSQAEFTKDAWVITGGLSVNWVSYKSLELFNTPVNEQEVRYDPIITPRIALLRKINDAFSVQANASWGFSPPTLAEVRPSNTIFNVTLEPERGMQIEIGSRGYFLNRKFFIDAALYHFALDQTIVVRRDVDGADYFVNAGSTNQNGMELLLHWQPRINSTFLSGFKMWSGVTLNAYEFKDYSKGTTSYSGNALTGVPKHVVTGGFDLKLSKGFYGYVTLNYTSSLPLDDANTAFADSYMLLGSRLGYKTSSINRLPIELFAGADNLLDQTYSLGNDLNAFGGRYFNAAAGRNYYAGIRLDFKVKQDN
ncbi:MAG: TonB-dependent receptor plug domain-containing protein [Cyclobacteriaceae bacterium]|jgi:iron complex outermembrane recepter protein|nr:TonB-dependent receptor plug domain-containing protein [Cyclobacteriaceae bacterium]